MRISEQAVKAAKSILNRSQYIPVTLVHEALTAAAPHMSAIESSEPSIGWLYDSDDAGTEFSENHPIESGECSDAKDIKPATAENLRNELLISWKAWAEDREELNRLRDETASETREHTFDDYMQIVEFFDKDKTAASFLREDGEGGFLSGVYRMAREVDKLRKEPSPAREQALEEAAVECETELTVTCPKCNSTPAPCDELETILWGNSVALSRPHDPEVWNRTVASCPRPFYTVELVTRQNAKEVIAAKDARIAELEKLLGLAQSVHRWSVDDHGNGVLYVCKGNHDKSETCKWDAFVPIECAEKAEADNKRLREALEPFAEIAELDIGKDEADIDLYRPMSERNALARLIRIGDLRRASAALEVKP